MDWFTILLLFVFFVLPLIQQIAEARKRKDLPDLPEDEGIDEAYLQAEEEALRRRTRRTPIPEPDSGGWSAEWGGWPGQEPEPAAKDAPSRDPAPAVKTPAPQPAPPPASVHGRDQERAERSAPEPRPERVLIERMERVLEERAVPVEATAIDRQAEHRRFHEQHRHGAPARVITAAHHSALGVALRNPAGLKQAILLAEVLGPPRAMKPLDKG